MLILIFFLSFRTRSSSSVWCPWHFSQFVLYPRCMEVRLLVGNAKLQRDQYLVKLSRVTPSESLQRGPLLSARTLAKETPGVRVTIFIFRAKCVSLTAIPRRRSLIILWRMNWDSTWNVKVLREPRKTFYTKHTLNWIPRFPLLVCPAGGAKPECNTGPSFHEVLRDTQFQNETS